MCTKINHIQKSTCILLERWISHHLGLNTTRLLVSVKMFSLKEKSRSRAIFLTALCQVPLEKSLTWLTGCSSLQFPSVLLNHASLVIWFIRGKYQNCHSAALSCQTPNIRDGSPRSNMIYNHNASFWNNDYIYRNLRPYYWVKLGNGKYKDWLGQALLLKCCWVQKQSALFQDNLLLKEQILYVYIIIANKLLIWI